jgi:hypothetical protein
MLHIKRLLIPLPPNTSFSTERFDLAFGETSLIVTHAWYGYSYGEIKKKSHNRLAFLVGARHALPLQTPILHVIMRSLIVFSIRIAISYRTTLQS